MGCFDTVVFYCPFCDAKNKYQSKAGNCDLKTYKAELVPAVIAESMDREEVNCDTCGKRLKFKNVTPSPRCIVIAMAAPVK
jgi:transcription elongation factor Elf1